MAQTSFFYSRQVDESPFESILREERSNYEADVDEALLRALDLLTSRWMVHVVLALADGPKRFNAIGRQFRINPNSLSERLKAMERLGLIERQVLSRIPPGVEYRLTAKGTQLAEALQPLVEWSRRWA